MENTTKYLVDGREVKVIQQLDNGTYLVEPIVEYESTDDFGEEYWFSCSGHPFVVDAVFDQPPLEKYHKDIEELATTNLKLHEELSKIRCDIALAKQELAATTKELSTCDQYSQLISFINNEITHVVDISGYSSIPTILTFKEAFEDNDGYNNRRGLKLLTLYGDTNGDLQWKINQYRDGSGGSNRTIMPFKSYEEAKLFAFKVTNEEIQKRIQKCSNITGVIVEYVNKLVHHHGYVIPHYVQEYINAEELKQRQEQIAKLESQLAALKQ